MKAWFGVLCLIFWASAQAQSVPQARLTISPSTGDLNTVFTINASQSVNAQGRNQDLEYQFRTDNRSSRTAFSRNPQLSFKPDRTGTLTAEVVVRDIRTGRTAINTTRYVVRENQQREVQIRVSDTNPQAGDSITYEAVVFGNNIIRSELSSRWDFNSDGRWDTNFRNTLIASDTPTAGKAFPTVEVRFPDGTTIVEQGFEINTDPTDRNRVNTTNYVSTSRNPLKAPVIEVTPLSNQIKENTNVTFDGSKTELLKDSYLEWVVESRTIKNQEKINYVFKTSGSHTVLLRHCIINDPTNCLETSVEITVEGKPNDQYLSLTWQNMSDPGRRRPNGDYALITETDTLRAHVRANGQSSQGQSFLYRWDFEGDGQWDTEFQEESSVKHAFNESGTYILTVEAIPSITTKNFERLEFAIPVYVERNRAPFGDFELSQTNNFVGERVLYTAEAKDPESGNNVQVRFDSDADGVWDSDFRNQRSWWWVYDTPGEYKVRLQIRDPQGRLKEISKVMTILPMPSPEIFIKVSHRTQNENQGILLDASQSVGRKLDYFWSVQGQDQLNLHGSRTSLRLPAGDYTVQLKIRDRLGAQDSVVFPVTFTESTTTTANTQPSFATSNTATSRTSNIINNLPGARMENNFILPPEGAPSIVSPFQIDAGGNVAELDYVSNMRATR